MEQFLYYTLYILCTKMADILPTTKYNYELLKDLGTHLVD